MSNTQDSDTNRLLLKGFLALDHGELDEAIVSFAEVLVNSPLHQRAEEALFVALKKKRGFEAELSGSGAELAQPRAEGAIAVRSSAPSAPEPKTAEAAPSLADQPLTSLADQPLTLKAGDSLPPVREQLDAVRLISLMESVGVLSASDSAVAQTRVPQMESELHAHWKGSGRGLREFSALEVVAGCQLRGVLDGKPVSIDEKTAARILARIAGVEFREIQAARLPPHRLRPVFPKSYARQQSVVAIESTEEEIVIATDNPFGDKVLRLASPTGEKRVGLVMCTSTQLRLALDQVYGKTVGKTEKLKVIEEKKSVLPRVAAVLLIGALGAFAWAYTQRGKNAQVDDLFSRYLPMLAMPEEGEGEGSGLDIDSAVGGAIDRVMSPIEKAKAMAAEHEKQQAEHKVMLEKVTGE